ncbi:MAG: 4-hydroxybenzoate octaprenyltransferase [Gammaproteobacteria bacterium]|nr:4-hydroxybenzoate octaprenyltransferase [Gammaproteobacteria bacterium]
MMSGKRTISLKPVGLLKDWIDLLRINRPVGYWLLMWPTLWGLLAAAEGAPQLDHLLIFIVGVLLMRSAGCLINDFADRKLDPHVERTKQRPLAAGRISSSAALTGFAILLSVALLLVFQLPWLVVQLSVVGAILATLYPFMKRYIHMPQAWLGMSFGWGTIMAWAAEQGSISNSTVPWLLFSANVLWSISYDTAYALGDRADDRKMGMKSAALWFGDYAIYAITLSGAGTILLIGIACWRYGVIVQSAIVLAACWQLWLCFMLNRQGENWGFQYFLKSHWSGAILCAGFIFSATMHEYLH